MGSFTVKNLWAILCYKCIIDKATNQISLVDIIEGITLGAEPAGAEYVEALEKELAEHEVVLLPMKMQLVMTWTRTDRDQPQIGEARAELFTPSGKVIARSLIDVDLTHAMNNRTFIQFPAFPYTGLGTYLMVVSSRLKGGKRWKKVAELNVDVVVAQETNDGNG